MKNKKILIVLLVLLLVVVGLFLIKRSKKSDTTEQMQNSPTSNITPEETTLKGSILDLVKLNKTQTCTFNVDTEGTMVAGTTYMSGKNIRYVSEVTMANTQKIATNMITDGEWIYTWSSASPQGMKMKLDAMQDMLNKPTSDKPVNNSTDTAKDLNASYDYTCRPWNGDAKMFELPNDVQFMDFTETMKSISGNSNTGKTQPDMCSACGYATDPKDVAACKAQFNC